MNNTIDFNTAKTIGTMSKKIDHIDDTVSGFFSFMHMVIYPISCWDWWQQISVKHGGWPRAKNWAIKSCLWWERCL